MRAIVFFVWAFFVSNVWAETYLGIKPYDTLGEVRARFPAAVFKDLRPAWAQEDERLISITGEGLPGTIVINFHDPRPYYRNWVSGSPKTNPAHADAEMSDDDALIVAWIRWIPTVPFPLQRLITKYGKPSRFFYAEDDFRPLAEWGKLALTIALSDDGKSVVNLEFDFTGKEKEEGSKRYFDRMARRRNDYSKAIAAKEDDSEDNISEKVDSELDSLRTLATSKGYDGAKLSEPRLRALRDCPATIEPILNQEKESGKPQYFLGCPGNDPRFKN